LLLFLLLWARVALVSDAGALDDGGVDSAPPPPPPPPPAAKTGVNEGAAITAIEKVASVINLIIVEFMRSSCLLRHRPRSNPNPGWLATFLVSRSRR
jgi:hypothetical protein